MPRLLYSPAAWQRDRRRTPRSGEAGLPQQASTSLFPVITAQSCIARNAQLAAFATQHTSPLLRQGEGQGSDDPVRGLQHTVHLAPAGNLAHCPAEARLPHRGGASGIRSLATPETVGADENQRGAMDLTANSPRTQQVGRAGAPLLPNPNYSTVPALPPVARGPYGAAVAVRRSAAGPTRRHHVPWQCGHCRGRHG